MKTTHTKKIETYLPVFPGFYGTLFEYDREEDDITNEIEEGRAPLDATYEDFSFNYEEYHNRIAEKACEKVQEALKDAGINCKIHFQKLVRPRQYNYSNDSVNVAIEMNLIELKGLKDYIKENLQAFDQYTKDKYTSVSGFVSFYSNDYKVWLTEYWSKIESDTVILGSLLDFVLINEEYHQDELYYSLDDQFYIEVEYNGDEE